MGKGGFDMVVKKRRLYTLAFRKKAVNRVMWKGKPRKDVTLLAEAKKLGIQDSVLRTWVRDPDLGGNPDSFRGKPAKKKVLKGLPTETQKSRRAKFVIPTAYACPHCEGPLLLPKG